jgi:hypothetical protein
MFDGDRVGHAETAWQEPNIRFGGMLFIKPVEVANKREPALLYPDLDLVSRNIIVRRNGARRLILCCRRHELTICCRWPSQCVWQLLRHGLGELRSGGGVPIRPERWRQDYADADKIYNH